ncbi:hypothetical protein ACFQ0T_33025 [Kitasatospora gansuensis]
MATEPEPQGPARRTPPAQSSRSASAAGSLRSASGLAGGRIVPAVSRGLPTRTGDSTPDWLEPAMAANGIGSFDWDIRRDRLEGDQRACAILGLE